ncbi:hypothetical protein OH809_05950 [Streptomyces sp. NBC_00873]|nr:hypothetical protein OH809_05950 [Streptomyces sp. NBC_00873]WTA47653.1 hypothetical protein OH821_37820 [Streptomyces sp. NBC_00842]
MRKEIDVIRREEIAPGVAQSPVNARRETMAAREAGQVRCRSVALR